MFVKAVAVLVRALLYFSWFRLEIDIVHCPPLYYHSHAMHNEIELSANLSALSLSSQIAPQCFFLFCLSFSFESFSGSASASTSVSDSNDNRFY